MEVDRVTGPVEGFDTEVEPSNEVDVASPSEDVESTCVAVGDEVLTDAEGTVLLCAEVVDANGVARGLVAVVIVTEEFVVTTAKVLLRKDVENIEGIELFPVVLTGILLVSDGNEDVVCALFLVVGNESEVEEGAEVVDDGR